MILTKSDSSAAAGREYALVPEVTWCRAIIRHNDFDTKALDDGGKVGDKGFLKDFFSLQIRLGVSFETDSLVLKISKKDNTDSFGRAYMLFSSDPEPLHIWDFSGKTTQFFRNDGSSFSYNSLGQLDREVVLEMYLCGFSDVKGLKTDEMAKKCFSIDSCIKGVTKCCCLWSDDYIDRSFNSRNAVVYGALDSLGLTGMKNLGNTCFMNSAIQCLVHTRKLVDYFLGDYRKDINYQNPTGMEGELAIAFGELLRRLWAPRGRTVDPKMFEQTLAGFADGQHDSQEYLGSLLNGLHEDLNHVKYMPYFEAKDAEGRPHEEVAEEYWQNHLALNDSIIVDTFHGQLGSKLACPDCNRVTIKFDFFMFLQLPLPSTNMRTLTLTVLSTNGAALPTPFTVTVPKSGKLADLTDTLRVTCSLRDNETLLVAETVEGCLFRLLEDSSKSLDCIKDDAKLVAYRLPKDVKKSNLVVFLHLGTEKLKTNQDQIGIPFLAEVLDPCFESDIRNKFLDNLIPFMKSDGDRLDVSDGDSGNYASKHSNKEDDKSPTIWDSDTDKQTVGETHVDSDFKFEMGFPRTREKLEMNQQIVVSNLPMKSWIKIPEVLVTWSGEMFNKYDTRLLTILPEVSNILTDTGESMSLYPKPFALKPFSRKNV